MSTRPTAEVITRGTSRFMPASSRSWSQHPQQQIAQIGGPGPAGEIGDGWHTLVWDGRDAGGRVQSSGLYFMRAASDQEVSVQKMTLVK